MTRSARRHGVCAYFVVAGLCVLSGAQGQDLGTMPSDLQPPEATDPGALPVPAQPRPASADDDELDEAAEPQAAAQDAETAGKTPGAYLLEVEAPDNLRALLLRHLDLSRFRQEPDITAFEVNRLSAAAPAQVRTLLQTEGYFDAKATVTRTPGEAGGPPTLTVRVEPGPQATVDRVTLEIQGDFQDALEADRRTQVRWRIMRARWPLRQGAPFTQSGWNSAKNELLASLRAEGYPAAILAGTAAQVDAATSGVRLLVIADSGPLFRLGEVRVEGVERTTEDAARNLAPFAPGDIFTERHLLDYQERLQRLGLYQGVAVELDADPAGAAAAPVIVRVRENPMQTATLSVGYSTNTGQRAGVSYTHRNVLGADWVATGRLQLGRDERLAAVDLKSYPLTDGWRNFGAASADYLNAAGALTQSQRIRAGRLVESERIDRLAYGEFTQTSIATSSVKTSARAVSGNYEWIYRDVNNIAFPTRGWIVDAKVGLGMSQDSTGESGPFARTHLRSTWYRPLGTRTGWFVQARGEMGYVFKRESLGVPDSLLFRTGGDDSVRGYGYQTLGPQRDGATVGGPVLLTGSLEVMRRISPRWRDWYGAAFVDIGNAAQRWQDWEGQRGYGVGVRWRSPVGALRVDLAYGEATKRLRLHLSVGAAF